MLNKNDLIDVGSSNKIVLVLSTDDTRRADMEYALYQEFFADKKLCSVERVVSHTVEHALLQYEVDMSKGESFAEKIDTALTLAPACLIVSEIIDITTAEAVVRAQVQGVSVIAGMRSGQSDIALEILASFGWNRDMYVLVQDPLDVV